MIVWAVELLGLTLTFPFILFVSSGASEMLMANAVSQLAAKTPGKEAAAMEAFASALRQVNSTTDQTEQTLSLDLFYTFATDRLAQFFNFTHVTRWPCQYNANFFAEFE